MDKERKKRLQTWRLILTEAMMLIIVAVSVIALMFIVMGYQLNKDGTLSQAGLVQIASTPTGAEITIDGEKLFYRTDTSRSLLDGEHQITLTRDGYDTWTKTVNIESGVLLRLDYPRLFKTGRAVETVRTFDNPLLFLNASTSRNSLLYATTTNELQLMSIKNDDVSVSNIPIADILPVDADGKPLTGKITDIIWSNNNDKILAKWQTSSIINHLLIDLKSPKNSSNLEREFGMQFNIIKFAEDSSNKLFALEKGNLRAIQINEHKISNILAASVQDFTIFESGVVYLATNDDSYTLNFYHEDNKTPAIIKTITEPNTHFAMGKYLDNVYIAISDDTHLQIFQSNNWSTENSNIEESAKIIDIALTSPLQKLYAHNNTRLIVGQTETHLTVFDTELAQISQFDTSSSNIFWLDEYMPASINSDNMLIVTDFDNSNRRELTKAQSGYDAVITKNNRWLYYVNIDDGIFKIMRERL